MNKRGDFGWTEIAKILLVLGVLIVLIILITIFKEKGTSLIDTFKDILRFGT
jgi:hypothetical protein